MRGLARLNLSIVRPASAPLALAVALVLFAFGHNAPASANVRQSDGPQASESSVGDDGGSVISATSPLPLSEALEQDSPTQSNVESTGWKTWVLSSEQGPAAVGLLTGGLARLGGSASPLSSRSLQVLFCTWQV